MSCNHCSTKFNFFHKEMGCSNCGLSFCNKCLKQKCKIPNKGANELPVCKTCYTNLISEGSLTSPTNIAPPDAYLKYIPNSFSLTCSRVDEVLLRRLEALENPAAPPITIYKQETKLQSLRTGLAPADQQLLDRLEKLKYDKNKAAPPSEDEIRRRLNSLKGENEYVEGPSKPVAFVADTRSDQEKVDSLLDMFMTERDIELAHNPEEGIEARIATLREQGVRPNEGTYISNLHDSGSDEEVDNIAKKIMDEVALEEKTSNILPKKVPSQSQSIESAEEKDNSSPELPWCVLCNKDAKYRCLDCDDLYCAECNIQVHKTWGDTDHRVIEYKQK